MDNNVLDDFGMPSSLAVWLGQDWEYGMTAILVAGFVSWLFMKDKSWLRREASFVIGGASAFLVAGTVAGVPFTLMACFSAIPVMLYMLAKDIEGYKQGE